MFLNTKCAFLFSLQFLSQLFVILRRSKLDITIIVLRFVCGPVSSIGIATDYGLDGSGSNPVGGKIFRPSRPALGSTQPPLKWVPGLSRG